MNDLVGQIAWANTTVFTDASISKTGSGVAWYNQSTGESYSSTTGGMANILQLEIYAIHCCITHLKENNITGNISIFTDSRGAVKAINNAVTKIALVHECRSMLQQISVNASIRIVWIKAEGKITPKITLQLL